jgi:hypothetical protein
MANSGLFFARSHHGHLPGASEFSANIGQKIEADSLDSIIVGQEQPHLLLG